ncbi:hypothetical protein BH09PSE3_BH09PSE3_22390 [soil metagenome]
MTKFYISIAAVALLSTAAPALAAETQTMTRDGVTYVYSVQETAKGTLIKGYQQGGSPFSLRVNNGRVAGESNGQSVSFRLSEVVHNAATDAATVISSR